MTKAIVYCRVSTDNQEKEGTSLQTQEESCLKYCEAKGYTVTQVFKETYSGASLNRPQIDKLKDSIESEPINAVVIYSLDRLSRDPLHIALLSQRFDELGIVLEATSESIENSEIGKLVNYIKGWAFKMELDKIKDRTSR
jgi:site-specific DNA recombinase